MRQDYTSATTNANLWSEPVEDIQGPLASNEQLEQL